MIINQKHIIIIFLLLFSQLIFGQQEIEIKGQITYPNGEAVFNAGVQLEKDTPIAYTDKNGFYSLKTMLKNKQKMSISHNGKRVKELTVNLIGNTTINITITNEDLNNLQTYELEAVVATGKSTLRKVKEKAFNVSVIDAQKLHNTNMDLGHSLDRVSGIRMRENGGVGSKMSLSMNGFQGKQVKFFIDGIPMENFGSAFQLNNIPIGIAERIEVYKGVVPVSLGADALGGAVNIVSDIYEKNYLSASYSYGSFNTHRSMINGAYVSKSGFVFQGNIYQNYSDNDYKIQADVAGIKNGKYYPNQTVKRFHDNYHNETFIGKIGVINKPYADRLLLGITLGKDYKEIQNGARIVTVFGAWHQKANIIMPSLLYQKKDWLIDHLDFRFNANMNFGETQNIDTINRRYNWFGEYKEYSKPGGERRYSLYKYKNNNGLLVANWDYKLNKHHSFSLNNTMTLFNRKGYDELEPEAERYSTPQKTIKNVVGLSYLLSKDDWNLSLFGKNYFQSSKYRTLYSLTSRFRETPEEFFNNSFNYFGYGLAYTYFINKNFQLKTSFEKTYRLPENEELFGDLINLEGNGELKPENSYNLNLGLTYWLNWKNNRAFFSANGFYRNAQNFIRPKLNTGQTMYIMDNLGKIIGKGIEAELNYKHKNIFSASLNITYQNLINNEEYVDGAKSPVYKDRIPNVPYLYGNLSANYKLPLFSSIRDLSIDVGYNMLYVHDFYLYWPSLGSKNSKFIIPKQISHDLNLTLNYKKKWQFTLECRNLLDNKLYDNFSLQKAGRNFSGKIKYQIF